MSTSRPAGIIITGGGTTAIGYATARLLREQGFKALAAGIKPETLAAAQAVRPKLSLPRFETQAEHRRPT
jgi:NAD(P)-dependent dehydrogenase (short-subunit alcohol dehydrogenase family)